MEEKRGPAPSFDQGWAERMRLSLETQPRGGLGPANDSSNNHEVLLFPHPPERAMTKMDHRPHFTDERPESRSFHD